MLERGKTFPSEQLSSKITFLLKAREGKEDRGEAGEKEGIYGIGLSKLEGGEYEGGDLFGSGTI